MATKTGGGTTNYRHAKGPRISPSDSQTNRVDTGASAEALARKFHETYERLAPSFGYETRKETRAFDPTTPNGKLMIAVCAELSAQDSGQGEAVAWRVRFRGFEMWNYTDEKDFAELREREGEQVEPLFAHPPKPAQVGEKWRAVTAIEAGQLHRFLSRNKQGGFANFPTVVDLILGLDHINAVVPAREGE